MKLFLMLLAVAALVMLLTRATPFKAGSHAAGRSPRGAFSTAVVILALRMARGVLAVMTVFAMLMAFKFLIIAVASVKAGASGGSQDLWLAAALAAGIGMLLYFLFWTSARMRRTVNQLHAERSHGGRPLLARHWSL